MIKKGLDSKVIVAKEKLAVLELQSWLECVAAENHSPLGEFALHQTVVDVQSIARKSTHPKLH